VKYFFFQNSAVYYLFFYFFIVFKILFAISSICTPSVSKTLSSKIENLIEYSYVPEDAQISETQSPLLSPYNIFRRQRSALRSITRLISSKRPHVKEYVQSSRMDQCSLAATTEEQ